MQKLKQGDALAYILSIILQRIPHELADQALDCEMQRPNGIVRLNGAGDGVAIGDIRLNQRPQTNRTGVAAGEIVQGRRQVALGRKSLADVRANISSAASHQYRTTKDGRLLRSNSKPPGPASFLRWIRSPQAGFRRRYASLPRLALRDSPSRPQRVIVRRCNIARTSVADKKSEGGKTRDGMVVIKKYANRRLYNTATSAYVTLDDLARMVREGVEFTVHDAKTNDDLTRQILTQIIFEEESRGEALLPVQFLRQLIGFYGNSMQGVLPSYLEMSLDSFTRQQEQLRGQFTRAFSAAPGGNLMEEAVRQNMAMFERAMRMFPGFAHARAEDEAAEASPAEARPAPAKDDAALDEMRRQMDEMRAQIDRLAQSKD